MVEEQRLGYAATVCPDGTPNLSPGTTAVWDADRLIFADIRSPGTVENLRHNPTIEVNVVDPISRKVPLQGHRYGAHGGTRSTKPWSSTASAGSSTRSGPSCSSRWSGSCRSHPLPTTWAHEEEVRERWERHHEALRKGEQGAPTGRVISSVYSVQQEVGALVDSLAGDPRRSSDAPAPTHRTQANVVGEEERQRDEGDDRRVGRRPRCTSLRRAGGDHRLRVRRRAPGGWRRVAPGSERRQGTR